MRNIIRLSFIVLLISACSTPNPKDEKAAIKKVLADQVACWNKGDLDCFMQGYWQSEELLFLGGSGPTYGWQTTLDNYRKRYPDQATKGQLQFDIISIDLLGDQHAFVVGKFTLKRTVGDASGHFTLLWQKVDGKWVIITDHTS